MNLADAAVKLKEVISKAAATASDSKSVFEAYIEAAEIMLEDDVASNKAIGSHGASFIQNRLENPKKLSILTHCNTGRFFSRQMCVYVAYSSLRKRRGRVYSCVFILAALQQLDMVPHLV